MRHRIRITGRSLREKDPTAQSLPYEEPSGPRMHPLEVHIEELQLDGFDPRNRHDIGDAVQRELALILGEGGLDPASLQNLEVSVLDAGAFAAGTADRPERTGRAIAQPVARAIQRSLGRARK